jgi:hypothetical protein
MARKPMTPAAKKAMAAMEASSGDKNADRKALPAFMLKGKGKGAKAKVKK